MRQIAVFARWPRAGQVKTRLSPALSAELSCTLHRAMLEDALEAVRAAAVERRALFWADAPEDVEALPAEFRCADPDLEIRRQTGVDLGARLEDAFGALLENAGDRAVVIGSDCPDLGSGTIESAFRALADHDLVLGPTRDGGYHLVGLRRRPAGLFTDIAWSSGREREKTLDRARSRGLSSFLLPELDDLDTPEDLLRWIRNRLIGHPGRTSRTAEALRGMGLLPGSGTPAG